MSDTAALPEGSEGPESGTMKDCNFNRHLREWMSVSCALLPFSLGLRRIGITIHECIVEYCSNTQDYAQLRNMKIYLQSRSQKFSRSISEFGREFQQICPTELQAMLLDSQQTLPRLSSHDKLAVLTKLIKSAIDCYVFLSRHQSWTNKLWAYLHRMGEAVELQMQKTPCWGSNVPAHPSERYFPTDPLKPQKKFDTFTIFLKLPVEIRIRIWKLALPAEIVQIYYHRLDDSGQKNDGIYCIPRSPSVLFSTCYESREVAFHKRSVQLRFLERKDGRGYDEFPHTRIDPIEDTLFMLTTPSRLTTKKFEDYIYQHTLYNGHRARQWAWEVSSWHMCLSPYSSAWRGSMPAVLRNMGEVKSLTVVLNNEAQYRWRELLGITWHFTKDLIFVPPEDREFAATAEVKFQQLITKVYRSKAMKGYTMPKVKIVEHALERENHTWTGRSFGEPGTLLRLWAAGLGR